MPVDQQTGGRSRLETWKEIGAFLGRNERTAKRWEAERGLPVRRVPGGGRAQVYAFADELSAWLGSEAPETPPTPPAEEPASAPEPPVEPSVAPTAPRRSRNAVAVSVVLLGVVSLGGAAWLVRPRAQPPVEARSGETDLTLQGEYYFSKRTPESLKAALAAFQTAARRNPRDAHAYVGLAKTYNLLREYTVMSPTEAYPKAQAAAERALALDDRLADAHSALGFVRFFWLHDVAGADQQFRRAIALDPTSAQAHHWRATYLLHLARYAESLDEIEQARRLAPTSRAILADRADILYLDGREEEAIRLLQELAAAEPDFRSPQSYLAMIHLTRGEDRPYLASARRAAELMQSPSTLEEVATAEAGYADGGRRGMLEALAQRQLSEHRRGLAEAYPAGRTIAYLGDDAAALRLLQEAVAAREASTVELASDPALRRFRSRPAFRALMATWGFPPPG